MHQYTEVEYLGLIIRPREVTMDPVKVHAVTNWPVPQNLRDLRGFLGFANFYRRFIQDFTQIAHPLNDLTKKDVPWIWGATQKQAFNVLKNSFTLQPILAIWEPGRPTQMKVDASRYAMGGVLLQQLKDQQWHPIVF